MSIKNRKKIVVLTSQPECAYQNQFLEGFLSEAFDCDYDVVVFSTFLKKGYSESFQHGELNIFTLCNVEDYDALVMVPDMLELGGVYHKLLEQTKSRYKKPVLIIDRKDDYYPYIIANDKDGIATIINHLVKVHNCRDIFFMAGPKEHLHSQFRLEGYRQAMEHNGLEVSEENIFYGDFWYDKGEELVSTLMKREKLPDAICCASDTMAISVLEALKKYGLEAPRDVIVTGFDCEGDAIKAYHSVTSIPRNNYKLGVDALKTVHALINGTSYRPFPKIYTEDEIIKRTCGCQSKNPVVVEEKPLNERICTSYDTIGFESGYNFMLEDMTTKDNISDALWVLSYYTCYLGEFDRFSLCLCDEWCNLQRSVDEPPRTFGYSNEMVLALVQQGGQKGSVDLNRRISKNCIAPELNEEREYPCAFYCTPVHYNEKAIGYSVLTYENKAKTYQQVYARWSRYVNVALDSLHRQLVTKRMYELMKERALKDELTGIYNRNGFYNLVPEYIQKAIDDNSKLLIITADLNCMKFINDHYGHCEGDFALIKCAESIVKCTEPIGGDSFRTGGDEFVYVNAGEFTVEQITELINSIRDTYTQMIKEANKPYPGQLAIGYSCSTILGFESLEKLLSPADNMMYEDKARLKAATSYEFART